MQKKPNGLGRGLGALLNPELLKASQANTSQNVSDTTTESPSANAFSHPITQQQNDNKQRPPSKTPAMTTLRTTHYMQKQLDDDQRVLQLPVSDLKPLNEQPRTEFYSSTLDELATSIKSYGILQPLVVTPSSENPQGYTIIAGERRWRAAQLAGLTHVPCVQRQPSEHSSLELALIENIQREELSALDEARAFSRLIDEHSYSQDNLAAKVGKDRATIANSLRLLGLPSEILNDLQTKAITAGHARALCSLDEKKLQLKVRDMIVSKKLSVRQTEDIVKELKKDRDAIEPNSKTSLAPDLRHLCDQFKGHLGTKVRITGTADRGKIEISYYTFEDLERISELMLTQQGLNPRRTNLT
jgi:ParB family chromosome partitioning protein